MRNMNTRTVRAAAIASMIVAAGVLGGCSSSSEPQSSATYYNEGDAGAQAPNVEPAAAPRFDGEDSTGKVVSDRAIIITGEMYMTVEDPILIADRAAGIVKNAGGRIDARSETAPDERSRGSAWLTMRIPSDKLDSVIDNLRTLGTVDQYSTNSADVTNVVTDLDAKISTLRASTARIEGLLADAKNISDIITLENELDRRQSELESLEAQQRGLADQVSMSTINLSLTTEPIVIVPPPDDSPDNFLSALAKGWHALVGFLSAALIVLGVLLPWLALIALVAIPAFLATRARKARAAEREAALEAPAAPPAPPAKTPAAKK